MLVVYKEGSTIKETWNEIIEAIRTEQLFDMKCPRWDVTKEPWNDIKYPRWDIVEQGETLSFTGCYAEQLGYEDVYFGFVPGDKRPRKDNTVPEDDGMLIFNFIWQSYDEFDIDRYQVAHLELQKFLMEKFPNDKLIIQITSQPTEYDWTKPVEHEKKEK